MSHENAPPTNMTISFQRHDVLFIQLRHGMITDDPCWKHLTKQPSKPKATKCSHRMFQNFQKHHSRFFLNL